MKNRKFKGDLKGFPLEIVEKMLERQVEQGNPRDVSVFENNKYADIEKRGFTWEYTKEGQEFWIDVINKNFDVFFKKYPKKDKRFKKYLKSKGYDLDRETGLNEYVSDHTWKDLYKLFSEYFKTKQ